MEAHQTWSQGGDSKGGDSKPSPRGFGHKLATLLICCIPFSESEISTGMPPEVGILTRKVRGTSTTPTQNSRCLSPLSMEVKTLVVNCLLAFMSYLCFIISVMHTVLSNLCVWTCRYGICMCKILHDALSTDIANNG